MRKIKQKKLKLHVKIGDTVKIIAGDYKGQIGEVTKTWAKKSKILVKDINMKTKHIRPQQEGESGQIMKKEAPIHSSNVMLYKNNSNP
uniref:Large ribosomal subunit protein uL24c n=1 Tax=Hommersandiophycus borowitzkae TaxID=268573 RepID=A0A1G4NU40_9FLOR|nr:Ribosomal protein L24 [Hommersandiophycus borowitzkae]SCW22213.1 Ribosomal protein L24 [Hommersandiophycus borowitzkae]